MNTTLGSVKNSNDKAGLKRYQDYELIHHLETDIKDLCASSMLGFTMFTKPDYEVGWHHERMCAALDKFYSKEIKRLMVFMPPRFGKSELVSRRFPAYLFGRNPNTSVIATSYSSDLANRMNRDVQRIIDSEEYGVLFPKTSLSGKNVRTTAQGSYLRNADIFEIVNHKGVYRSAGVGGSITGMGGEYLIIDDPIRNQADADSQVYRDKLWDWYCSTLYTRLAPEGCILVTLTRWHEDDLAGRLLAQKDGDPWTVISFPAIREDLNNSDDPRELGEPLWGSRYDLDAMLQMKSAVGSRVWTSLYQQRPAPDSGTIIERTWWKFYSTIPENFDEVITSWDLTFKDGANSDFVVGQVWGKVGANKYLLDQVRARMSFTQTIDAFKNLAAKWTNAKAHLVEEAANGAALISTLKSKMSGIIAVRPTDSKVNRAKAVAPQIEAGNVFLPDQASHGWVGDLIEEFTVFPFGTNDDQVDACTQALWRLGSQKNEFDWSPVSLKKTSTWR